MHLFFAPKPETYKLTTGTLWTFKPQELDTAEKHISLIAARNDTAAFQILLCCDENCILNVGTDAVLAQSGPQPVFRLEACGALPCVMQIEDMHTDDEGYLRADALLSYPTLELSRMESRAVWCEIHVPKDTAPGKYPFTVRILKTELLEDEELLGEVTAELEVFSYALPDVRDNRFHLDLWQHSSNIARKCETPLWSDAHFEALEKYIRSLGELGQKAATIVASEVPWCGQSSVMEQRYRANLYEYSIIRTFRHADGSFSCDYSAMQRYIDLCVQYGIDREIEVFGLCGVWKSDNGVIGALADDYPDAVRIRYYDEASGTYRFMRKASEIDWYIHSLEQYFIRTNQIERVRVAADEPQDVDAYRKTIRHLKVIAPSFRYKAAIGHVEFISEFQNEIYDFVPFIHPLCDHYPEIKSYMDTLEGKRFLYYVCCGPFIPNTFVASPLAETLYICVFASYTRMEGFLRWNYTVWNDDPRKDIRYGIWHAGDTNFVYPQRNGAPLLTLRYKLLKRGIGLYEMLEALRECGDGEQLEKAFNFVLREKDIAKCVRRDRIEEIASIDDADYTALRRYLLEKLSK